MLKFDTHLCLVSKQAAPNLIPAMDTETKPRRVVLATSPEMQQHSKWLGAVMHRHGIEVDTLEIPDAYNFSSCWEVLSDWIGLQKDGVALNVTGGTKVMAMAAQDVFREAGNPVFYVNVENDSVLRLDRGEAPHVLPTKIKLKEYLESHGYLVANKVQRPDVLSDERDFLNRLAYESEHLSRAFGRLNFLAQQAKGTLTATLDANDRDNSKLGQLIGMFSDTGRLKVEGGNLLFLHDENRKFVNGGWLEHLVYQSVAQLSHKLGLSDYAVGLEVIFPDGKTRNELDVAILHRNTLHLIECKTANFFAPNGRTEETSGTDALYKLDALRDMGGVRTKALLIDYRGSLSDADKRRAAAMRLNILTGSQLRDISGALKGWLK